MKVRALIEALQKQDPDAEVLFGSVEGETNYPVGGGLPGNSKADGSPIVMLAPITLSGVGGF